MNNFVVETKMQKCRGATMIEVLVSLFVLAIGLLGVLGMQAEGTQANQRGMFSTQAAFLAQSMADRIRVNDAPDTAGTPSVSTGRYHGTDTNGTYAAGNCDAADCDNDALLAYDQNEWEKALEAQLPGGRGVIAWNAGNQVYTISVIWLERSGERTNSIDLTKADCGAIDPDPGFACYRMEVRP